MKIIDLILGSLAIIFLLIWPLGSLISIILLLMLQLVSMKKDTFNSKVIYLFLFFIAYMVFKTFLIGDFYGNIKYLEKMMLLVITFLSIYPLRTKQKKQLIIVFILSISILQIYSFIHILNFTYTYDLALNEFTNFSYINKAIGFERPYIGFLSSISILFLLFDNNISIKSIYKPLLIFLSISYIVFISAKLAFILSFLFLLIYFFKYGKFKYLIGYLILISITVLIFSKSLSIVDRFSKLSNDERIFLWTNGLELIENDNNFSFLFGSSNLDFVKLKEKLKTINISKSNDEYKRYYSKRNKNIHNQYFSIFIVGGFIGLILMLGPFLYLVLIFIKKKNISSFLCIISIMIFMFVENIFERQMGVMICGILIAINISNFNYQNHRLKSNN